MGNFKLTKTINSGVIIEHEGVKILVDGLFGEEHLFDPLMQEQKNDIINGLPPYDNIDVLLFTHLHSDHYSKDLVDQWLRDNTKAKVIMPRDSSYSINEYQDNIINVEGEKYNLYWSLGNLKIRGIRTGHIMLDCPDHYCFEVSFKEWAVILTGDMSLDTLAHILDNRMADKCTLFLNPLHIYEVWNKKIHIEEILKLDKIFIYHLPSEGYDTLNFRKSIEDLWPEINADIPNGELLLSPMMLLNNKGQI